MIVVRDIFRLKFGKAKEALALWREGSETLRNLGHLPDRMLTDLTGTYYTLVLETSYKNITEFEESLPKIFSNEKYQQWYQRFIPLAEAGYREIFRVVE
ncbi:MAG: hypothetical protein ACM3UR_02330 [Bacteroidota bacterium]|jgi:hypothetical protein|nr:hypothetical protein [Ignavibacteria bacterium]MCU7498484.1 hypothetical protein [Ignavibacteria bacterium]MCU7512618.1 hypothetical protein [Ignavibacteria bacterium]MCU7521226.1 hypothetical protein [Ignavibacteria bacterium]MCU7525050.1 hypothetical protein [Ignavibacteria bacterium]